MSWEGQRNRAQRIWHNLVLQNMAPVYVCDGHDGGAVKKTKKNMMQTFFIVLVAVVS